MLASYTEDQISSVKAKPIMSSNQGARGPAQPFEIAHKFYAVDRPLDGEQRGQLSSAFQSQQWAIPTGALSLLTLGIMGPRYAAKYKYIARPVTQTRMLSAFFGLFGFVIGGRIGYVTMYRHNRNKFDENSNPQRAFEILANYPPQIGYAYYRTTARDPAYVMKNPDSIDWKREPPFPMNLVRSTMMANRGPGGHSPQSPPNNGQQQKPDQYASYSNDQAPEPSFYEVRENAAGGSENVQSDSTETYASSWDRIRAQNQNQNQNSSSATNYGQNGSYGGYGSSTNYGQNGSYSQNGSYTQSSIGSSGIGSGTLATGTQSAGSFSQGSQPSSGTLTPIPPPPALSGPPRLQAETDAAYEDQKQFDEELERERMGYGVKDDFSDSEQKWQK